MSIAIVGCQESRTFDIHFYKNGRLVSIDTRKTAESGESFTLSGEYNEIKVFTWENIEGLIPVTDAETVSLN